MKVQWNSDWPNSNRQCIEFVSGSPIIRVKWYESSLEEAVDWMGKRQIIAQHKKIKRFLLHNGKVYKGPGSDSKTTEQLPLAEIRKWQILSLYECTYTIYYILLLF